MYLVLKSKKETEWKHKFAELDLDCIGSAVEQTLLHFCIFELYSLSIYYIKVNKQQSTYLIKLKSSKNNYSII